MLSVLWFVLLLGVILFVAYRRFSLLQASIALTVLTLAYTLFSPASLGWKVAAWLPVIALWLLNINALRQTFITRPFLRTYRRLLPSMSSTEKEALEAGTVWWDGQLFTGAPAWDQLMSSPAPRLSAEEQSFLDGPCEELCRMLDDFDITHRLGDMPPQVWEFIKSKGFFAMIIPKKYGGLQFSAYAHSCVLIKVASRSA